jgi:DNA (cytosine-5)-methyltransferase 1
MKRTRRKRKAPTAIDLFCGCGGLTLGLKRAGFTVLGAVDNDELSVETYSANHPEVEVWETDIRELSVLSVKRRLGLRKGELDLLAGCPPCQGFSTMRTLNGGRRVRDPDTKDLLLEFERFAEELLPRAIMLENVPGLARDRRFASFRRSMKMLEYIDNVDVLDAADYAVPQRRRRLIYVAGRKGSIEFARPARVSRTVKDAIKRLPRPGKSGDAVHDVPEKRSKKVTRIIARIPKNGGSRTDLPRSAQLQCHLDCDGFKDVYGRMAWNAPSPTITGGCFNPSKGRFLHPSQNRAITMREAALLQGFPRRYRFPRVESKQAVALLIGNALPPEFVKRHASQIVRWLNRPDEQRKRT